MTVRKRGHVKSPRPRGHFQGGPNSGKQAGEGKGYGGRRHAMGGVTQDGMREGGHAADLFPRPLVHAKGKRRRSLRRRTGDSNPNPAPGLIPPSVGGCAHHWHCPTPARRPPPMAVTGSQSNHPALAWSHPTARSLSQPTVMFSTRSRMSSPTDRISHGGYMSGVTTCEGIRHKTLCGFEIGDGLLNLKSKIECLDFSTCERI